MIFFGLLFYILCTLLFILFAILFYARIYKIILKKSLNSDEISIGFFHPFCNSGGGGERVLWSAIKAIHDNYENIVCVIYSGDTDVTLEEILKNVENRFTIKIDSSRTQIVYLKWRFLVLDKYYPVFTLLGQSLGSMILSIEALFKYIPDIYFETTGYAFTYPIFRYMAGIPVCCYVHYPTISTDMLKKVSDRQESFNNRQLISRSQILTKGKLIYYKIFAKLYSLCGRCACCIMVNSSWTLAHINSLWSIAYKTQVVYPPCDVESFSNISNENRDDKFIISSVAQFRPEKNHKLQIKAFADFINNLNESEKENVKLLLIGSCRNDDDSRRVDSLKNLTKELKLQDKVEFKINQSFSQLKSLLADSAVGIHSMKDEHFGIGVVECMAAGTIIIAHNSAGPKEDIVIPYRGETTGYLAETEDDYKDCLMKIFHQTKTQRNTIRKAARESARRFSQKEFCLKFIDCFYSKCLQNFVSKSK